MRAAALVLCVLLAGCDEPPPQPQVRLVCAVDGVETYRSQPARWWKVYEGVWWTRNQAQQYQPSARESCRTEEA